MPTASSRFVHHKQNQTMHTMCTSENILQTNWSTIFAHAQNFNLVTPARTLSSKNKTDTAQHACPGKQSVITSIKNMSTSSKFQMPQARILHQERKQTMHTICAKENILQSKLSRIYPQAQNYNCLKQVFPYQNRTDSAYHVCLEKQSAMQLINKIHTNSQFHRFKQEVSITNTHTLHTMHS